MYGWLLALLIALLQMCLGSAPRVREVARQHTLDGIQLNEDLRVCTMHCSTYLSFACLLGALQSKVQINKEGSSTSPLARQQCQLLLEER